MDGSSTGIGKVHSIPCTVVVPDGIAPAKLKTFFEPLIRPVHSKNESTLYSSSFRGRPLKGVDVNLPEGYKGIVVNSSDQPADTLTESPVIIDNEGETMSRSWHVTGAFTSYKYWSLDTPPTVDDKLMSISKWVTTAQCIHQPISPDIEDSSMEITNTQ